MSVSRRNRWLAPKSGRTPDSSLSHNICLKYIERRILTTLETPGTVGAFLDARGPYLLLWVAVLVTAICLHLWFRHPATRRALRAATVLATGHVFGFVWGLSGSGVATPPPGLIVIGPLAILAVVGAFVFNLAGPWVLALTIKRTFERADQEGPTPNVFLIGAIILALLVTAFVPLPAFALGAWYVARSTGRRKPTLAAVVTVLGLAGMAFALIEHIWLHQYHGPTWFLEGPGFAGVYVAPESAIPYALSALAVILGIGIKLYPQRRRPAESIA